MVGGLADILILCASPSLLCLRRPHSFTFTWGHPNGFTHTKRVGRPGGPLYQGPKGPSGGLVGVLGVPEDDVDVADFFDALLGKFLLPLSFSCVASQ